MKNERCENFGMKMTNTEANKNERCENCRFCHVNDYSGEFECRRYPHIASFLMPNGERMVEFRITIAQNWCGEFSRIPEEKECATCRYAGAPGHPICIDCVDHENWCKYD